MFWQRTIRGSIRNFHNICKLSDVLRLEHHASVVGVHQRYLLGGTRACSFPIGAYRWFETDVETRREIMKEWECEPEWSDLVHCRYFHPHTGKELREPWEYQPALGDLVKFIGTIQGTINSRWEQVAPGVRQVAEIASSAITCLHFMQGDKLLGEFSGTVIHPSGLILTCAQALGSSSKSKDELAKIKVSVAVDPFNCYRFDYEGAVLYADFHYDIAIIKIRCGRSLESARLGSLYELCPSSSLLYLGGYTCPTPTDSYPQFYVTQCELISGQTMTVDQGGILEHLLPVSFAPTPYVDPLAPTDASGETVKPLGGPIVNPRGEVVGMISTRFGKNYAVPVDLIRKILHHFVKYGRVIRPCLGLRLTFLNEGSRAQIEEENILIHNISNGFLVVKVIPGSPADRAGFLPGDVVVEIDGKCIGSSKELTDVLWDKVGVPLEVIVKRSADSSMTFTVVPEEASPDASESEHTTDLFKCAQASAREASKVEALPEAGRGSGAVVYVDDTFDILLI